MPWPALITRPAEAVRQAPVKNTDETGWKQAGPEALALGSGDHHGGLLRDPSATEATRASGVAGRSDHRGIVFSDRWWGYNGLPLEQRQVCWAHLKRDFQKCIERGGDAEASAESVLEVVDGFVPGLGGTFASGRLTGRLWCAVGPGRRGTPGVWSVVVGCADSKE